MIKPIRAILRVLQGHIFLSDNREVRLIQSPPQTDNTPCITIDNSSGSRTLNKTITNKNLPLPITHPQYDPGDPNKLYSQQVIQEKRGVDLDLNIWCNTEDERAEIIQNVRTLFYLAQSDNYRFCSQYIEETHCCSTLQSICPTHNLAVGEMRGTKGQCINPTLNGYMNIFAAYDLERSSFDVEPAYDIDDLETENMTLRSIIRVSTDYYDYHTIGGIVSDNILNETTINYKGC